LGTPPEIRVCQESTGFCIIVNRELARYFK